MPPKFYTKGIIFLSVFFLVSCDQGESPKDLTDYVKSMKESHLEAQKKAPPAKAKTLTPAVYDAAHVSEPFHGMRPDTSKSAAAQTLQSYPLSMLQFVGTVTKNKTTYAYVIAPDNMIYQVREGDVIGDQHGKVLHIYTDRIDVVEEDIEEGRPAMKRIITLQLRNAT